MSDRRSLSRCTSAAGTPPTHPLARIVSPHRSMLRWLIGATLPAALVMSQLLPTHATPVHADFAAAPAFALVGSAVSHAGDASLSEAALADLSTDSLSGTSSWGAPLAASHVVTVAGNGARLRSGPGTSYTIKEKLNTGRSVTLLGQHADWYNVRTASGHEGWMSHDVLTLSPAATDGLPTVDVPAAAEPATRQQPTTKNDPVVDQPAVGDPVTELSTSFGRTAASIALQKVGRPYVWGAAGPRAFDCSGLLVYTYRQLGLALPHSSSAMFSSAYGSIIRSSRSLQPGDILFFRNTAGWGITHVAIYAGHGMMVTANSPRTGVQYQSLFSSYWQRHWAGAVRPYAQ